MIEVLALGPCVITQDGTDPPAELKQRKNLALLVYLARSPNRMRSRQHLIGLLWPDRPEERARHSLREAIRILRKVLGGNGMTVSDDRLRLSERAVHFDLDDFQRLEDKGNVRGAASLIRGEFLEGLSIQDASEFEDWLSSERLYWRGRCVDVLVRCAEEYLSAGDSRSATANTQRAHVMDPGSSAAMRILLKSLALGGNRTRALDYYEIHTERLRELGVAPDIETADLADRIRRQKEWKLPAHVPTSAVSGAESRRAPLVGRSTQLAQLLAAWRTAAEGKASIACITGDAGVGKTRLAEELLSRAALDGAVTVVFRAVEGDLAVPDSGVLGLARGGMLEAPGLTTAPPRAISAFAQRIPEWADRFGQSEPTQESLTPALGEVVRAISSERPIFLLVDDAQYCDRESLLTLGSVVRDVADRPLFLCVTATSTPMREEVDQLRAQIGRQFAGATVALRELQLRDIRELTEWALPTYTGDQLDRLTRRVAADSAGFPLLVVELLHAVALGMDIEQTNGAWPKPLRTLTDTLPCNLPDPIVAAVRVGFHRLSKPAQNLLSAAAVIGRPAPVDLLGRCADLGGRSLDEALDELEWQRWLSADARGYSFVATIVRRIVEQDMLTEGQRQRIRVAADRCS
ncbi:MAG: AAA family ATPase [Gemmatimonadales bacterium]